MFCLNLPIWQVAAPVVSLPGDLRCVQHKKFFATCLPISRLDNYLKPYRRRTGLSQAELASILGLKTEAQISRFEKRHRMPTVAVAFGLAVALAVPINELFAGLAQHIAKAVRTRRSHLLKKLQNTQPPASQRKQHARKVKWLTTAEENQTNTK